MSKYTTPAERIAELVRDAGSYRKAAKALGICHVYLHRVAQGDKDASDNLLSLLGLVKEVSYRVDKSSARVDNKERAEKL